MLAHHPFQKLTHERPPILQVHFIMRDAVTGQVMTCEVESVRCPQVILVCQLGYQGQVP